MLRKAAFGIAAPALLWIIASGVASASPDSQAGLTPFELLLSVLVDARGRSEFSDELNQTLADYFMEELISPATGEAPGQVRERLKARFYAEYPHPPTAFEVLRAALIYADEIGALTDDISARFYDYFVDDLIPSVTGETPERVRERLGDPTRARENAAGFYYYWGRRYSGDGNYELAIADLSRAIELDPEHIRPYSERAYAYLQVGDMDGAIADMSKVIELEPDYAYGYTMRGIIYQEWGEYELAIADFTNAAEIETDNASHYMDRGHAYLLLGDVESAKEDYNRAGSLEPKLNLYSVAIDDFTNVIELSPDNVELYIGRAYFYRLLREYEQAIEDYTKAIELDPNNGAFYRGRAWGYFEMGEYELAIADFTSALELLPDDLDIYMKRAEAYNIVGERRLAIADYTRAIELDPDNAHLRAARASAYHALGIYGRAAIDLTKAAHLAPGVADYYLERAVVHRDMGRLDLALLDYDRAIEIDTENPDFYYERATALYEFGRYKEAVDGYSVALEVYDYGGADAYVGRALSYMAIGEYGHATDDFRIAVFSLEYEDGKDFYEHAIEAFSGAIEEQPHHALYRDRAYFYRLTGEYELTLRDLDAAIELCSDCVELYVDRASLYGDMDELDLAITHLNIAIELDPYNAQFYHDRGVAYESTMDYDRAIDDYLLAMELGGRRPEFLLSLGNLYFRMALAEGIVRTGSELPWLMPGLASSPPAIEAEFGDAFTYYERILLDIGRASIQAYVSSAHILIWFGDSGSIAGDNAFTYLDSIHPAYAHFKDVYHYPEEFADSAGVLAVVGKASKEIGDYDRAIAELDRAIELDPDSWSYYRDRGIARYLTGAYDEAIADYESAIALQPGDAYLYMFKGLAYQMKGDDELAIPNYDIAIALNPDDPYFRFFRSAALDDLGKESEYEKHFALLEEEYDVQLALRLLLPPDDSSFAFGAVAD